MPRVVVDLDPHVLGVLPLRRPVSPLLPIPAPLDPHTDRDAWMVAERRWVRRPNLIEHDLPRTHVLRLTVGVHSSSSNTCSMNTRRPASPIGCGLYAAAVDAEEWLAAAGMGLIEKDFGREDEPDVIGCLLVQRIEEGLKFRAFIRPGTTGEQRTTCAEWAVSRIQRFIEYGPEPDGWKARSDMDDGWQLWAREQLLPDFD